MSQDLLFFIHVPKTAGSSLNAMLQASGKLGFEHFENQLKKDGYLAALKSAEWISGHIVFDEALRRATESGRNVRLFSCVREPMSQLISNINWVANIVNRGKRLFYGSSLQVQILSLEASLLNYDEPRAVMAFMLKNANWFLNYQSRHVLGSQFARMKRSDIDATLDKYEYVGLTEDIQRLATAMDLPKETQIPEENVSVRHIPKSVFATEEFREFANHHNRIDNVLYEAVKEKFR